MTPELLREFKTAIDTTGFPLENFVCNLLDSRGWHTINGRYYCDDIDGRAREIDILSYKIGKGEFVDVVSALLLSCKKDASNSWVFLTKRKPKRDPNYSWDPVCTYSANPLVAALERKTNLTGIYKEKIGSLRKSLIEVEKNVFAFQQVRGGGPQNDKAIFSSIESLIKAREHELKNFAEKSTSLNRKRRRRIYSINLVTVVDAPMYEATYSGDICRFREIAEMKYLARYIVNRKEVVARIHFCSKRKASVLLNRFQRLAEKELAIFDDAVGYAYNNWWDDPQKDIFGETLAKLLAPLVGLYVDNLNHEEFIAEFDIERSDQGALKIRVWLDETQVEKLNRMKGLKKRLIKILRDNMNFQGEFFFEAQIPF